MNNMHPVFSQIFTDFQNGLSAASKIAQEEAKADVIRRQARLKQCEVTVTTRDGVTTYPALAKSTFDAVIDAASHVTFPCKISAEVAK